jgi:hypothetical protein
VSAPPIPSKPADLELIARLKSQLQYAELRIRVLEERLRLMRIEKYGASGEKLSDAQLELFELEPVVSEMIEQAESEHAPVALPSSALSKACQYALTLWMKLTRFLEHPELELSNNLAENSMRPVALGRKNWIHIGSQQAGPKVAAILSVVESCRRLKLPVRDYLAAVLPGFADLPIQRLPELTPAAWVAQHSY